MDISVYLRIPVAVERSKAFLLKQTQHNLEHMLEHEIKRISGERLRDLGLFSLEKSRLGAILSMCINT